LRTVHLFDLLNLLLPESLQLLFLQVLVMKLWLRNGERTPATPARRQRKTTKETTSIRRKTTPMVTYFSFDQFFSTAIHQHT
jgi:hypothetical protein